MGFRTFVDRDGHKWEIRPASRDRWDLTPADDNPLPPRTVPPPGYETDPYELSKEELDRLLEQLRQRLEEKFRHERDMADQRYSDEIGLRKFIGPDKGQDLP